MITSHLNTYYFIPTNIITINQSLKSFKCMIIGANLTSLYRWHSAGIPLVHWCYTAGLQTIRDKWLCFYIFKFTSLSTWLLYFWINTLFQLLLQLLIKAIISNTYYIFIWPLSWFLDFSFNDFIGLKKYAGSYWTTWPNVEFWTQLPKKNPGLVKSSLQRTTCGWAIEKGPRTIVYLLEFDFDTGPKDDPTLFAQAISEDNSTLWYDTMKEEMESMAKNQVWDLVELLKEVVAIGCKWV